MIHEVICNISPCSMNKSANTSIHLKFPKSSKRDRSSLGKGGMKGRRGGSGKMGEEHERKFKKQVSGGGGWVVWLRN